jgi:hypothetical protein
MCYQRRRIDSILDAQKAWNDFLINYRPIPKSEENQTHFRLNPDLERGVPGLAETNRLVHLREDTRRFLESEPIKQDINDLANHLIASLFYYEKQTSSRPDGNYIACQGTIYNSRSEWQLNRLQAQSDVVFSMNWKTRPLIFGPWENCSANALVLTHISRSERMKIRKRSRGYANPFLCPIPVRTTNRSFSSKVNLSGVIDQMAEKASFPLEGCKCDLRVPDRSTLVKISIWLKGNQPEGRPYLISNFPRKIMMEDLKKGRNLNHPRSVIGHPNTLTFIVLTKTRSGLKRANSLPSVGPPPHSLKRKDQTSPFRISVKDKPRLRRTRSLERRSIASDMSLKRSLSLPRNGLVELEKDPENGTELQSDWGLATASGDSDGHPDIQDSASDEEYWSLSSEDGDDWGMAADYDDLAEQFAS